MYNFHFQNPIELSHPKHFPLIDYVVADPGDYSCTFLWVCAKEDVKDHPHLMADLAREYQLALDLTGNLDAPLGDTQ